MSSSLITHAFKHIPVICCRPFTRYRCKTKRNPHNLRPLCTSTPAPLSFSVGLWNCQSAVNKAAFIPAFATQSTLSILALTETWIRPEDTATPAALSNNFSFSHTPRHTGRGGGTGQLTSFLEELDVLLSSLPEDGRPLVVLGDFNIHQDKPQAIELNTLLASFDLERLHTTATHRPARTTPPSPWLSDILREHRTVLRAAERRWRKSKDPADLAQRHHSDRSNRCLSGRHLGLDEGTPPSTQPCQDRTPCLSSQPCC
ncbi:uncharacterized protein LOC127646829 isoform X1 [Xyrauchen texanus]|uniref:uncharacterized protein LOC127646829 isoform X1 n=1 Tax=Xyrauchen texanus TaxID=154827 RepID=UPI00224199A6|nr:uncharacterized protein LOC127646829 isoform X1 [Xyrauchen texanus]